MHGLRGVRLFHGAFSPFLKSDDCLITRSRFYRPLSNHSLKTCLLTSLLWSLRNKGSMIDS